MENREQLMKELQAINQWERDQKDLWFWEKLGRLPFVLLDKVIPRLIQDKIGTALNEVGKYIQTGGDYLTSHQGILNLLEQRTKEESPTDPGSAPLSSMPFTMEQARTLPLHVMDLTARELAASHTKVAAVQGAATGFGGLFTIVADIPAMLGLSLKVLQEIAICYGYDPKDAKERTFIVKCLQFASSDIVGKQAILEELAEYDKTGKQIQVMSQLQGWREVMNTYRDNFGWKKMFQLVPLAGTLFGAYINRDSLKQVAETGMMMYRKRRITERLHVMVPDPTSTITPDAAAAPAEAVK